MNCIICNNIISGPNYTVCKACRQNYGCLTSPKGIQHIGICQHHGLSNQCYKHIYCLKCIEKNINLVRKLMKINDLQ